VDALRQHGAAPVSACCTATRAVQRPGLNTDDHLRNHGFLYDGPDGWRLSPAYDLNPVPVDIKPRILATAIDLDDTTASLDLALKVAAYFELNEAEARKIAKEVGGAVGAWRDVAAGLGLTLGQIDRVASAFEHEDLQAVLAL
jgi:serine/threonine-protein kinase HipA